VKRRLLIILGLIAVLVAGALGLYYFPRLLPKTTGAVPPTGAGQPQMISEVKRRTLVQAIDCAGDIQPVTQVEVKAEVGGRVKKVFVRPGQVVPGGELLIEIDDRDLQTEKRAVETEMQGNEVALQKNRRAFERAEKLFAQRLVSQEFFDNAKTELEVSQNEYLRATNRREIVLDRLLKTKVTAPFSGTILSLPIVEGQVVVAAASVNSGTLLMTIADLSSFIIVTQVNQVDIAYLKPGQLGTFTVESVPNTQMQAEVGFISPMATVKNNLKGFAVEFVIKNPDPRLRPGMTADVLLPVSTAMQALSVPLAAIFNEEGKEGSVSVVYLVSREEKEPLTKREVQLGIVNYDYAEIKVGLSEGDRVSLRRPPREKGS
jgi:RND family efflux transporter MFP subunit